MPQSVISVTLPFIRLVFDSLLVHASDTELVPVCVGDLHFCIIIERYLFIMYIVSTEKQKFHL